MTAPTADEKKLAVTRYLFTVASSYKRWKTVSLAIAWVAAGIALYLGLTNIGTIGGRESLGSIAAYGLAVLVLGIVLYVVVPLLPRPSVPCPHCGGAVPITKNPKPFTYLSNYEVYRVCPHCQVPLTP